MGTATTLYEKDFYAWTQEQIELLKQRAFNRLDVEHIREEMENVGAKERTELASRLAVLITHLLKWQYQPESQSKSWDLTIWNQRQDLKTLFEYSSSLTSTQNLSVALDKAYKRAVAGALKETGFLKNPFPKELPYTIEQILDDEFFPGSTLA